MNELKNLVPLLSECKLIPRGSFPDTAMVHVEIWESTTYGDEDRTTYSQTVMLRSDAVEYKEKAEAVGIANVEITSAPTLAEILEVLPEKCKLAMWHNVDGKRTYQIVSWARPEWSVNPTKSALLTWMWINRIEVDR